MMLQHATSAQICKSQHGMRAGSQASRPDVLTRATTSSKADVKDYVELGKSGLKVPAVGIGAWSWGDRSGYWGYGQEYGKDASQEAFAALLDAGLTFVDTAEVYGFGKSEEFLGEFMRDAGPDGQRIQIATKFAPLPWRLTADSVPGALKKSLARLGRSKAELYMIHWPGFLFNAFSNDAYIEGLARAKQQGLVDAIGVSNFSAGRVRQALRKLKGSGIPLVSNQVQYSLLYREPEKTGVLEVCRENGVTLVAYSPMAQGLLTGKYRVGGKKPFGARSALINDARIRQVEPVLSLMEAIATERKKTMLQVALNWCICKGALPIPGAKNGKQVQEIAGALGWRLSEGEIAELDKVSLNIPVPAGYGAPFEKW